MYITYSFITVKTERSTLQYNLSRRTATIYMANAYAATQDSNQWHDCHAGQPQPATTRRGTRGVQVKLWDPLRTRATHERLKRCDHDKALYKSTFTFTFNTTTTTNSL